MNSFVKEARASKLWFDEDNMWVSLTDGRTLSIPLVWFPRLLDAASEAREDYELSGYGAAVHWEHLDEDISIPNLLLGYGAVAARTSVA